jgi:KAP family P-loop domain
MTHTGPQLRLLPDNPTGTDLLDFGLVADSVAGAVSVATEPMAIGLHGPWGSGKSTVLELVRLRIEADKRTCIIVTNPWEYDDHADVKGTLIGAVLQRLETLASTTPGLGDKVLKLIRRVSWTRATTAIARGALTMQWDVKGLVDAFTPTSDEGDDQPRTMAGFREAFEEVLDELDIEHVVVLVDDLDRCLPLAVLATLEAIKLFLAVPKMAFVIAADQEMVREAIAAGLGEQHRSAVFARDYLDKIVQVPVALPLPSLDDAEAYIATLLCQRDGLRVNELITHIDERRLAGITPYADDMMDGPLTADHNLLAKQVAYGLGPVDVGNPRRVKRFLNALEVRQTVALRRNVELQPEILAKLYLFEHRFAGTFQRLVAQPPNQRQRLLGEWESWARTDATDAPSGLPVEARELLAADPSLADTNLDQYLTLAAQLSAVRVASGVSREVVRLSRDILGASDIARRTATTKALELPLEERRDLLTALFDSARRGAGVNHAVEAAIKLGEATPDQVDLIASNIRDLRAKLDAGHGSSLATSSAPAFQGLARELGDLPDTSEWAKQAIVAEFE